MAHQIIPQTGPLKDQLQPVFQISQNPGNHNRTNHQRAWTATVVRSFFGSVQFSLQSFCSPRTGLLNTSGGCGWTDTDVADSAHVQDLDNFVQVSAATTHY